MKISQLKQKLQTIITHLTNLEELRNNLVQNPNNLSCNTIEIEKTKSQLEKTFAEIESENLRKIKAELINRKIKRKTKKLKAKEKYRQKRCNILQQAATISSSSASDPLNLQDVLRKTKLRSSKKYLAFIENLETLHRLKGGDDSCQLKKSLSSIKSIWQCTAKQVNEETDKNSLEKSWNKVTFGVKPEIELTCSREEFVERRLIWDSYLDSSNGSQIPVGWVNPKADASPEWKQFLQLT